MKFFIIYTWLLDYYDYWHEIEHFSEVRIVSKMNPPRDSRSLLYRIQNSLIGGFEFLNTISKGKIF